ncbi:hypothetical protein BF49_5114 [Bradyrhizobium sp.]|nr:hypothetical protein BF49_5114 [Bradyrhizobium sp.]
MPQPVARTVWPKRRRRQGLRPVVAKRHVANIDDFSARRNNRVFCGILAQTCIGPIVREDAFARHRRSIQLAHGSMRDSHGWLQNDAAPALADPLPLFAAAQRDPVHRRTHGGHLEKVTLSRALPMEVTLCAVQFFAICF